MNQERRLAVLEAFACTKPREFDAFLLAWSEANSEQQPDPIDPVYIAEVAKPGVAFENFAELSKDSPITKRKRKTGVIDESTAAVSTVDTVSTES